MPTDPAALGLIPGKNKKFSQEKNVYGAEVNQRRWSEDNGQRLKNVDQTHLVLDCGKLVLQNTFYLDITLPNLATLSVTALYTLLWSLSSCGLLTSFSVI